MEYPGTDAAYVKAGDSKGTATAAGGSVAPGSGVALPNALGTGAKMFQLGYRHEFSKRTSVKFAYVKLDNDTAASYALGGLAAPTIAGESQSAWVMYASHTF